MKCFSALLISFIPIILNARTPSIILYEQRDVVGNIKTQHMREAILTYNLLLNTAELHIHQPGGAIGNTADLHQDGHKKAVFDSEGNIVNDGTNDDSYNFALPTQEPIMHFVLDILPWLIYGNSGGDPTTPAERLEAYVNDLESGLMKMRGSKMRNLNMESLERTELEGIGVFLSAIGSAGFKKIGDFLKENQPTSKDLDAITTELFQGLLDVISGNNPKAPDSGK